MGASVGAIERITTREGRRLDVRQVRPDDKELLREGFERLSPQARYRRFFAPIAHLSEDDLRYLTEIDHRDHEALLALDRGGGLVGVARYIRGAEPELAEAAVVVADDWQRRGVATGLLERLAERARVAGVTHFVAVVLSENTEALELFEHFAPGQPARRSASGHLEVLLELPEPGAVRGSRLGHALREAARGRLAVNPYRVLRRAIGRASEQAGT